MLVKTPVCFAGEQVSYSHQDVVLEGYVSNPNTETFPGKRPAVLIVHQWKGLGDYEKHRADMLADLGYVAFAVDVYGQGIRPQNKKEAAAESSKYKGDPDLARARMKAALGKALSLKNVDPDRVAAIGYCFGGTMALELARSGADIDAAVSFHGGLSTRKPAAIGAVKAAIQIHHGDADPLVSKEEITGFKKEMVMSGTDWHFISYADAVHAFTEKEARDDPSNGVAYNEDADRRSWAYTKGFLQQVFD